MVALYRLVLVHQYACVEGIAQNALDPAPAPLLAVARGGSLCGQCLADLAQAAPLLPLGKHEAHKRGFCIVNHYALFILGVAVSVRTHACGLIAALARPLLAVSRVVSLANSSSTPAINQKRALLPLYRGYAC